MAEPDIKLTTLADAARLIPDGARVHFGGMAVHNHPMAFVYELLRQGTRGLTVVSHVSASDVDILIGAERVRRPGQRFILGIGLNVNLDRGHFPPVITPSATSLKMELGGGVSRERVVRALMSRLDKWYARLKADRLEEIEHQLRKRSSLSGRTITIECRGRRHTGTVIDVSLLDGILLELPDQTARYFPEALTTVLSKRPALPAAKCAKSPYPRRFEKIQEIRKK